MDLWIMVTVMQINYLTHSVTVFYDDVVYSISLDDPIEQLYDGIIQIPTWALKPRDYYLDKSVEKDMEIIRAMV